MRGTGRGDPPQVSSGTGQCRNDHRKGLGQSVKESLEGSPLSQDGQRWVKASTALVILPSTRTHRPLSGVPAEWLGLSCQR